ncbi:MAG: right-handed parallel beta-helix repeat-containing protein [Planctomycetota bacterium]
MDRGIPVVAALAALAVGASAQVQPPAGPVADSGKSIDEAEPRIPLTQETAPGNASTEFFIARSGSYYLTRNETTATPNRDIIRVGAPDVTIDLNGFTIDGRGLANEGIDVLSSASARVTVQNGSIIGCRGNPVILRGAHSVARNISAVGGGIGAARGIYLTNVGGLVEGCRVVDADVEGVRVGDGGTVRDCVIENAASNGIWLNQGGRVIGCTIRATGPSGAGITALDGSIVDGCVIEGAASGILAQDECLITDNIVRDCAGVGLQTIIGGTVRGNRIIRCTTGIAVFRSGNRVDSNDIIGCTTGLVSALADAIDNAIIRNFAQGNGTAYNVGAGNFFSVTANSVTSANYANIEQ